MIIAFIEQALLASHNIALLDLLEIFLVPDPGMEPWVLQIALESSSFLERSLHGHLFHLVGFKVFGRRFRQKGKPYLSFH